MNHVSGQRVQHCTRVRWTLRRARNRPLNALARKVVGGPRDDAAFVQGVHHYLSGDLEMIEYVPR